MVSDRGTDITTMYTHMLWTTQARREHLRNTKYFSCQCQRCADPMELGTHISALRCLAETPKVLRSFLILAEQAKMVPPSWIIY